MIVQSVQWGRVDRGRVWHVLESDGTLICKNEVPREVTQGQPPQGAFICDRCEMLVGVLHAAVAVAVAQQP